MTSQQSSNMASVTERSDDPTNDNIKLYNFEEIEEHSVQIKKRLFVTDFLKRTTGSEHEDEGNYISKLSKMISMIYNAYTNKEASDKSSQDNSNVRQSIIEKFHQNWAIEFTSNGLYTLKEATLRLLNEDLVSVASVKAMEWTDRRKILTCSDDLVSVTCSDDGKIKAYTKDLKLLISIDLNTLLHFDKHSVCGPSISTVKISKPTHSSESYDILFLYEQTIYIIPLGKDSATFQLYKMKSYAEQILSFDIYNDTEHGRIISLVLEHGEQESIFLNYPELEDSILVKVDKKPKHFKLSTSLLNANNELIVNPKLLFSRDGTRCAFLSKSKKLYIYRVPFPFKNDSRTQFTSEIVEVVEFNWWSTSSVITCSTLNQLSVLDVTSKSNILGDGDVTEDVEGMPIISNSHDGKFFMLEYDPNVNQLKLDQQFLLLQEQQRQMQTLENAAETSLFSAFTTLLSFLFPKAIKEPEELKEENMIPSTLSLAYRLYRFSKKEPEAEFKEKLEQGDLEEALLLAKSYSLDVDQVYKKMWRRQVISLFSIGTLKQVSDKNWIVDECVQRVANNEESMRALIECGIAVTEQILNETDDEDILQKRLKLLYYLDRLDLYMKLADQQYKADQYNSFRNNELLEYAKEKASMKDLDSLRTVLSYGLRIEKLNHSSRSISPYMILDILSNIPESLDPRLYEDMLPGVEAGKLKRWDQINLSRLSNDFCEEESPKLDTLYPTSLEITEWYISRAETIDITSGMVSYAESLLSIGTSKNVPGLEEKGEQLKFLSQMIYNRGNLFHLNKQLLSIKDYEENMSNYDKFKLLVNKNSTDIVSQLVNKGIHFVGHCEEEKTGKDSLIYKFVAHELAPYNFEQCCKVFTAPQRTAILGDNETVVLLAIECIYSVKNFKENTENIIRVLNSLPTSNIHEELEDQVNQLKRNTLAVTILSKHKLSIQLSLSMDLEVEGKNIMQELLQTGIRSGKSEKSYQTLYNDLNNLHKSCFAHLPLNDIYHQFLKNCCLSGHAHLAYDYIVSKCILPFDESDDVIYEATTELFNSSVQPTDSSIMIAEKCISLHQSLQNEKHISLSQEHKWKREKDVLEAFRLIGRTYSNYAPALFLKKNSPVEVVKYLIANNETGTDETSLELFYNISKLLGGTEHDKKEIKKLAIEVSLEQAGSGNVSVVKTLMEQKHVGVYKICAKMSIDSLSDISHEDRLSFASYAIQNCDTSELSEMISNYELIESQELFSTRSSIKPLTECVLLAHQEFEKLSKNTPFNANFLGCAPIYSTSSESSFLSKFGISSNSLEIERLLSMKASQIRNCIITGINISLQSLLEFASLSLLNGHIISFVSILIQVPMEQIDQVKKLFDSILSSQPRDTKSSIVERMLRVFNFYFGLRLLLLENPEGLSDYYNELSIEEIVEKALDSDLKNEFSSIVDILTLYNGLLYICSHFNDLYVLSSEKLSCLRFISEEEYRIKSLTVISQTNNRDHLETVLKVADKLNLKNEEFYLSYLETVLKNKVISQEEKSFIFEFITTLNNEKVTSLLSQFREPSLAREYELPKLAFLIDMLLILGNYQYRDQKLVLDTLTEECSGITNKEYHDILNANTPDSLFSLLHPYINHHNVNNILESIEKVNSNVERPRFYFFITESLLTSTSIDNKDKPSLVEEYIGKLYENDIRTMIEKLSFDNSYKLSLVIRISIMKNSLNFITNSELEQVVRDNIFRMLAVKRVFQRKELDNLLGLLDKYFRNQVGLIQVLANIALCTRSKVMIESVLNDLKEEYTNAFPNSTEESVNQQPSFLSTDATKVYLEIVDVIIQCLVDHAEELSNETETNDEEDLTQEELENLIYEEDGLCWPPNNSKLACTYLYIILGSVKDMFEFFNTILSHIESMTKKEDDFPVRTRIALIRIIRKYKKPSTPSPEEQIPTTTTEDSGTTEVQQRQDSPKVETSPIGNEDMLLAVYQTKDAIGENFPTQKDVYSQTPKPPSDEFRNMFSSLLSSASNDKQFKALSFILRIWHKEKRQFQAFLEALLVDLLKTLMEKNVEEDVVLNITKELSELLAESSAHDLFEHVFNKGSYCFSFKFAIQTNHTSMNMLVVERLKSLAETNPESLDSEPMSVIFNECISKNLIAKLLSNSIITLLFNCKKLKLSENSESHLVTELALGGLNQKANNNNQTLLACEYLQRKVYGMHFRMCDLNSGLFLLRRYLQQCQTHNKIDKRVKEQCTNTLKKLMK